MILQTHACDICKTPVTEGNGHIQTKKDVIFHTNQTDGYPVSPYKSTEKVDLCGHCYLSIQDGRELHGEGAMGNNRFWLTESQRVKILIEFDYLWKKRPSEDPKVVLSLVLEKLEIK